MIASTHPEAEHELIEGALHYKRRVNGPLAAAFITEYERAVAQLLKYPQFGAVWHPPLRRYPLRRFPYSIIYHPSDDVIRIVAVAHQSRRPGYWAGRA